MKTNNNMKFKLKEDLKSDVKESFLSLKEDLKRKLKEILSDDNRAPKFLHMLIENGWKKTTELKLLDWLFEVAMFEIKESEGEI